MPSRHLLPLCFALCLAPCWVLGQQPATPASTALDTTLPDVVITATRTEKQGDELPIPVLSIQREQIQQIGASRLSDVLAEQTGLVLTQDHGTGLQIQGLDPDYTLILLNGQPMVGRTAGTLDLSRIAIQDIERIEIIKGPVSSLYGSEALAGVVNIITRKPTAPWAVGLRGRYSTNNTLDAGASLGMRRGGTFWSVDLNRFSTAGYDFNPDAFGQTVAPNRAYTASGQFQHLAGQFIIGLNARYYHEEQDIAFQASETAPVVTGTGTVEEWNLNPSLKWIPRDELTLTTWLYTTAYRTEERTLSQGATTEQAQSAFDQRLYRPELQADWTLADNHVLTLGAGTTLERLNATRYNAGQGQETYFLYAQSDWQPSARWNVITGFRYDAPSAFAGQFSPKVAAQYSLSRGLRVQGSVGVGFKAPDFRQLYLDFDNASVGYSVYGVRALRSSLQRLEAAGQISDYNQEPATLSTSLVPESSVALNLGLEWQAQRGRLRASLNGFMNDVSNLIDTYVIARKTNNQSVFSYRNLNQVRTYGLELSGSYKPAFAQGLSVQWGYQYLVAQDQAVLDDLDAGLYYVRPDGRTDVQLQRQDYHGLFNRSTHTANLRLFYQHPRSKTGGSARLTYRSRFGAFDTNGNQIYDRYDDYVPGFMQLNLSLYQEVLPGWQLQLGADNLLNYTDPANQPAIAGRLLYVQSVVRLEGKPKAQP